MELTGKDCVYVTAGTLPDEVQVARMLIVGDPGPDAHSLAPVVRTVGHPPAGLDVAGVFAFRAGQAWQGVVVRAGRRESSSAFASRQLEDSHWCIQARTWSSFRWDNAVPVTEPTWFTRGDQVQLIGSERVGTVTNASRLDGRTVYRVWFGADDTRSLGDDSLESFILDDAQPATWVRAGAAGAASFARTLTFNLRLCTDASQGRQVPPMAARRPVRHLSL